MKKQNNKKWDLHQTLCYKPLVTCTVLKLLCPAALFIPPAIVLLTGFLGIILIPHKQQEMSAFHWLWDLPCKLSLQKSSFRHSCWIPIVQLGRNSRLKNALRLIQKICWESMKKLLDVNKNLPFVGSWTKKFDLNSWIIHAVLSRHAEVNQESTLFQWHYLPVGKCHGCSQRWRGFLSSHFQEHSRADSWVGMQSSSALSLIIPMQPLCPWMVFVFLNQAYSRDLYRSVHRFHTRGTC